MSSRPPRGTARLAAILDALPDALLLVNCNGTVVNANRIALEIFESPGTALVGRGLLDLLPAFDSKLIPGSMRRPEDAPEPRTKPKRMVARRTDGSQFMVEVTSANLEDGRTPYEYSYSDHGNGYTGDELLMLVVRDLTGTLDTEAELARQQRQTEMILRAAAEGVIGVDTEGRVVLVNPAAAQILGYRASDLGGQELHPLVHHSRPDGSPLPYEETPLAQTLRSGRKYRVRGQVLWTKDGSAVPVDLTTAPVRDGDQLVGAVLAFTDRTAFNGLAARHRQLQSVLETGLRGPLEHLRSQLAGLAADPAGQLWPEANQILHHLAAGYARMTTLVDNVLSYQRLDTGGEKLRRERVSLDEVVSAGVEGAIELIGPGRVQFAVHAPPVEAEVDPVRLAQALAHLVADVAGVDVTGTAASPSAGDSTIVVAAAQRGDVVRIEVRGPHGGGNPVHEPLVRGIVRRHGGVLQAHEVPGASGGSAYVLEVPVASDGAGSADAPEARRSQRGGETTVMPVPAQPVRGTDGTGAADGTEGKNGTGGADGTGGTGGADGSGAAAGTDGGGAIALPAPSSEAVPAPVPASASGAPADGGTGAGRRRARRALAQAGEHANGSGGHAEAHAPAGPPVPQQADPQQADPPGLGRQTAAESAAPAERAAFALPPAAADRARAAQQAPGTAAAPAEQDRPTGRRRRRTADSGAHSTGEAPGRHGGEQSRQYEHGVVAASPILGGTARPSPQESRPQAPPAPGSGGPAEHSPGVHVRTLGQGVPLPRSSGQHSGQPPGPAEQQPTQYPARPQPAPASGPGRRRKLAAPPEDDERASAQPRQNHHSPQAQQRFALPHGRQFAIGAPEAGAEGPEPLDGPNGAVEVTDGRAPAAQPRPVDDELPPEPLDNPRRLLVWPEPDATTQQALTDRGYRPVVVHSREEVDAQIEAYPAALFVDPLTGPITRTALKSLRQAAMAAEVPVLVTAGLGQASREAAYGADPAVLLKALAPRDSEQHPPRILLVEEHAAIAHAFTAALERRGMQVAHASSDADAAQLAAQVHPNLVVMDLMQVRRRRAGIVDWLRVNGMLSRTPFVVYTSADIDPVELPRLESGETVLFLAERSTSTEVQSRIVDLLAKIGSA